MYRKPDKIMTRIIENKSLSQKNKGKPGGKVRGTEVAGVFAKQETGN